MQDSPVRTGRRRFLGSAGAAAVMTGLAPAALSPAAAAASRSPGFVNVADHGAVREEDRPGLERPLTDVEIGRVNLLAIASAMATIDEQGGGTIYFPSGTYLARPDPRSGTIIHVRSDTTVLFAEGARLQVVLGGEPSYYVIRNRRCDKTGCQDAPVRNLTIIGAHLIGVRNRALTHGYGIVIESGRNIRIRDCHISRMEHDGMYLVAGSDRRPNLDVVVRASSFEDNGRHGVTLGHVRNIIIAGCAFRRTGGSAQGASSGLVLEPAYQPLAQNRDVRLFGNTFESNEGMGLLVSQKNPNEAMVAVGNRFIDNGAWGVSLANVGPRDGTDPVLGRGPGAVFYGNTTSGNNRLRTASTTSAGAVRLTSPDAIVVANTASGDLEYALWMHHQYTVQTTAGPTGDTVQETVCGSVVVDNRFTNTDKGAIGHHADCEIASHVVADNVISDGSDG